VTWCVAAAPGVGAHPAGRAAQRHAGRGLRRPWGGDCGR
jgi:hypothetical protein